MQVVEYVEKGVLCAGHSCELLNIVYDEDVDTLVETHEVVEVLVKYRVGVLYLEQVSRYIKDTQFGVQLFYF